MLNMSLDSDTTVAEVAKKKRGRPPKYKTEEERIEARRARQRKQIYKPNPEKCGRPPKYATEEERIEARRARERERRCAMTPEARHELNRAQKNTHKLRVQRAIQHEKILKKIIPLIEQKSSHEFLLDFLQTNLPL